MQTTALVTGANGHLGNNLVRHLLRRNDAVVAGVRNPQRARHALDGLDCRTVTLDLLDKPSLVQAMQGVDVLYQVGAVFKHWARDPEQEIFQANMVGTRNAIEAAAEAGVRRVVYVSSLAALDRTRVPIDEAGWNPDTKNWYFRSKTESERLAWQLADQFGIEMVAVLPGAMIGRNCFGNTPTMSLLEAILAGKLPVDPGFYFNFVDVADVAEACWLAAVNGRPGERYLLANTGCTSIADIARIAQREFPERQLKLPARPPRRLLEFLALAMEGVGRLRGTEPQLQRNYLSAFTVQEVCDISKARRELGFDPRPAKDVIADTLSYLAGRATGAAGLPGLPSTAHHEAP